MKDIGTKQDDSPNADGKVTAAEYNNVQVELENVVTLAGQTLDTPVDTERQLMQSIAVGGERVSRADTETAQIGEIVLPDNSAAILTVNLPSANLFVNAVVYFEPVIDQLYSVFALTIGRSGNNIMGLAEDLVLNSELADNQKIKMTWKGGAVGWLVSQVETVGTNL